MLNDEMHPLAIRFVNGPTLSRPTAQAKPPSLAKNRRYTEKKGESLLEN